jgi:hypothetical protein
MNLPTRQRKRYARGPEEVDVMEMDEEVITPFELQKEEGVPIGPMAAFPDTGSDRLNAQQVWESGQIDQGIYQMDFNIFFQSGDWMDYISQEEVQGDMPMAKGNFNNPPYQPTQGAQDAAIQEIMAAQGGIIGLRHGGRARYADPDWIVRKSDVEEEAGSRMGQQGMGQSNTNEFDINDMIISIDTTGRGEPIIVQDIMSGKWKVMGNDGRVIEFDTIEEAQTYKKQIAPFAKGGIAGLRNGGRIGYEMGGTHTAWGQDKAFRIWNILPDDIQAHYGNFSNFFDTDDWHGVNMAKGGRVKRDNGGIMNLGGLEKDYRTTGGFVPIGEYEKKDDVPARLSKNEFVMTADAVRAAGGGSINKGAQRMYDTMKHLEAQPTAKRMTA